jgi:hypothetical protein
MDPGRDRESGPLVRTQTAGHAPRLGALYARGAYARTGTDESSPDIGMQLEAPVLIKRPKCRAVGVARNGP